MRILMLSDAETAGGAAIAASRLASALVAEGHSVHRVVQRPDGRNHVWETVVLSPALSPLQRVMARALPPERQPGLLSGDCKRGLLEILHRVRPDIINVHNLHSAYSLGWSYELVEVCCDAAPVVWTLHDMWSFTGRCAYRYDCTKLIAGCDASCPTADEYPSLEPSLIHGAWAGKKKLLERQNRLAAVSPSQWLAGEAQQGLWRGRRVVVIANGIPLETYEPLDRDLARKALGLSVQGPVLLTVAHAFLEERKGAGLLQSALRHITRKPVTMLTMGSDPSAFEGEGIHVHHLGFVDHERTRALAYNAADLLVHAAPTDNLPNVLLEAIACGTPVAAFKTGGIPEIVRADVSGWIAAEMTAECLAATIDRAIDSLAATSYRSTCRDLAQSEYAMQRQAQEYAALFTELLQPGVAT